MNKEKLHEIVEKKYPLESESKKMVKLAGDAGLGLGTVRRIFSLNNSDRKIRFDTASNFVDALGLGDNVYAVFDREDISDNIAGHKLGNAADPKEARKNELQSSANSNKEHYLKHRDKILRNNKRYRAENIDKIKQRARKNRAEHHEKMLEYEKEYRSRNRDKIAEISRKHCKENSAKISRRRRIYYEAKKKNPDLTTKQFMAKQLAETLKNLKIKREREEEVRENGVSYKGKMGKTALQLLMEVAKVETKQYKIGKMVVAIAGVKADEDHFWAFYVNGKMASEGAETYKTSDDEEISWKLEKINQDS